MLRRWNCGSIAGDLSRDQALGLALFVMSILGIGLYGWFVYGWPLPTLQITVFVAIAGILLIVAWIGYTLATTPSAPLQAELAPEVSEPVGSAGKTERNA